LRTIGSGRPLAVTPEQRNDKRALNVLHGQRY